MTKKIIAIFDFDGTLTTGASSRLMFFRQLAGLPKLLSGLFIEYCHHGLSKLQFTQDLPRGAYLDSLLLTGLTREELQTQAQHFISHILARYLRHEAIKRLNFHQDNGHNCMIISGALDIYLKPWAKQYNVEQVICTELEFDSETGESTGRMRNTYCLGQRKVEQFEKIYANRDDYIIYAYGDSTHDLELLNYADHAFYRTFTHD
ncbi:HAD-IB family hydrolase [Legionella brunensis]|uniref:2-hydroxy-3-keto-5-methylthiopentenyl-1-phosphate phosphatase n=1 Tax=Legionella brunensis TaxID=29422 RepID=A0A0W0S4J5_9GAMM|nr:HAD-IB family hydrolase [Legionella brunensis]KTC78001.1 2-hydroxy-3-keto-5-methylthiopentenyl-1-phosphate phosphatase [Legionella brunensis]